MAIPLRSYVMGELRRDTVESKFEHQKVEKQIYEEWERSGAFAPRTDQQTNGEAEKRKPFTILMPPPNANASLHAGHGMYTIDDILIRYRRMQGYAAQWIPGRDHAGFETQFVYEKHLAKEGKSRLDFDRKTLYNNIAKFVEDNSGLIFEQFRALGFSADWDRSVFTLDPHVILRVFETFKQMESEGKVYRSDYLVNYCTHCGTSLAELEILHPERTDPLYYVRYPLLERKASEPEYIVVATTRPEPIMIDTHLAVNPKDKKNKWLVGRKLANPLTGKPMEIVTDEFVDPKFGTGVVKLTPAHDKNDYEVAKKLGLPIINGVNMNGRMTAEAGKEYEGLTVKKACEAVVSKLLERGLIDRIDENYLHSASVCYKCGRDMEPMTVPNWYIAVADLKPPVIKAIKTKQTQFFPKKFEKQILDWMEIMHDWPISRQVAWGIRIPVWYRVDGNENKIMVNVIDNNEQFHGTIDQLVNRGATPARGVEKRKLTLAQIKTGLQQVIVPIYEEANKVEYKVDMVEPTEGNWIQETDTFDTWFSSGQWPLVTLKDDEYNSRYPTDVMATMVDILKIWVSRMMMFGLYVQKEVPFKNVYLWPVVVDAKGQKMSKSKGNVINPIDLIGKYGADALRMSLLFGNGEGGRVPLSEDKVRAMRNFGNKIWNMNRFFLMMYEKSGITNLKFANSQMEGLQKEDKKILKELSGIVKQMTALLDKYKFSQAADTIYEFMWHTVADVYIEQVKDRADQEVALSVLQHVLFTGLKLLHPFMPFVTEAIYTELPKDRTGMLITAKWPTTANPPSLKASEGHGASAGKPEAK